LASRERLGRREIFKVLVVCNYVDGMARGLEVVPPYLESLEYGEELLIVSVVIELRSSEGAAVKCDGVNVAVVGANGENAGDGIVGCVSFDYRRKGRIEMVEDGGRNEGIDLRSLKASSQAGDHCHGSFLRVNRVSGTVMSE
jgi:hypothetical protein